MRGEKNDRSGVIAMANGPPVAKESAILRWPSPGRPCHGIITEWPMHQLVVHWTATGTLLCQVPLGLACKACEENVKRRWLGFVGAYDPGQGRHVVLEITAGAACACPELLDRDFSYVGYRLTTLRLGKSKTSRVGATIEPPIQGAVVPLPVDYAKVIFRLFGLESVPPSAMALFGKGVSQ